MPGGNGTGPLGMGPMTGRTAGFCAGYNIPGYMNPVPGRGRGFRGCGGGRGGGRGWRNQFFATGLTGWRRATGWQAGDIPQAPTREQQLDALKSQAGNLEDALGDIRKRIGELEAGKTGT